MKTSFFPTLKILNQQFIRIISQLIKPFYHCFYRIKYKAIDDPLKDIYINPKDIAGWYRGNLYNEITFIGQIKGGDWNKKTSRKKERLGSSKYRAIVERYVHHKPWIETALFKEKYTDKEQTKKLPFQAQNLQELAEIYEKRYSPIFNSMKRVGFLPANGNLAPAFVCIGEKGELYYTMDGNHRMYMAMILGLNKIPVKVLKRHKKWQHIKEQIKRNPEAIHTTLKEFYNHPDLVGYLPP